MLQRVSKAEWRNLYPEFAKVPAWLQMTLSSKYDTEVEAPIYHDIVMRRASETADILRNQGFEAAMAHPHYAKVRDYLMQHLSEEDLEAALTSRVEPASEDDAATAPEDDAATASEADSDSDGDYNSDSDAASEIDNTSEVVTTSKVGTAAKTAAAKAAAQEQENHKNLKRKFTDSKLVKEQATAHTGADHKKPRLDELVSERTHAAALQAIKMQYIERIIKKQQKYLRRKERELFRLRVTRKEAGRMAIYYELTKLRDSSMNTEKESSDAEAALDCLADAHHSDVLTDMNEASRLALDLLEEIDRTKIDIETFATLRETMEDSYIL